MKTCRCGNQIGDNAKYCPFCGFRHTHPTVERLAWIIGIGLAVITLLGLMRL